MSKLGVLPPLTKNYILERVTQEEIMEFYSTVPVNRHTLQGNSFTSIMRVDSHPTCNFYYKEDRRGEERLKLKDWNGSFDGDIFDVAAWRTKINSKTSQGFKLLLHKIASDFNIHQYKEGKEERKKLDIVVQEHIKRSTLKVFKVIPRAWNSYDKKYWVERLGITWELLKVAKVLPVSELHIEGEDGYLQKIYSYYSKDPAYAYYGGVINGINIWKIYFPYRGKTGKKFLTNYSFIQGLHLFRPARVGIITKSLKDVLVFKTLGLEAIAVPSETYLMSADEFFDFKSKCDVVITNFDYDRAGILLANKYKRIHKCSPLMFTIGRFNQPNYGVKDLSEFRDLYGLERTRQLIASIVDKYYDDLQEINLYNYNSLKWIA